MMRSPNFATRSFVTLKGFLLLGGFLALDGLTSTFQEKLFKDRAGTASTSCFFKQAALTSKLVTLGVYCLILDCFNTFLMNLDL